MNFSKFINKLQRIALFIFLVIIPWEAVIFYTMVIAQPRYVSTSDVVIKQVSEANVSTGSGISALLGVNNTSSEDARYLTNYILSNDMVKKLDKKLNLRDAYYLEGSDFIYELPKDATQEELLDYFKSRVKISLDEQTYILKVSTEGFQPEFALKLNQAILKESETFINNISQDIATDQLQYAHNQLKEAEKRLHSAKNKLLNYQDENQLIDPKNNAQMVNQLVSNLQVQLSKLKTEERQLLSYLNDTAPQIVSIRSQIIAIEAQIEEENAKLTSPTSTKLNTQMVQFETIKSEVEFASDLYKMSLSSLEKARLEAFRKMKNMVVISAPYKAEEPLYPRKQYIIWTSLVFLLIFYGFVRLLMAVVKDHAS
ncbi:MAG: capsule biosynthesis protein [Moraxellaceae bacterium]|nr:capsule biosynthesis protein [Moraxellaceae bacterium]